MASPEASLTSLGAGNLFNVNGLVAVVTGGGTGIGLMITKALVANGAAKVYILGRRLAKLEEAASATDPAVVVPVVCDVTSIEALRAAAARVEAEAGHANLLVCNSGVLGPFGAKVTPETTLDDFVAANLAASPAEYTETFAVNVSAMWFTAMTFLKLLAAGNAKKNVEQASQVVAVSSIASFNKKNTGGWAYSQSKAACMHLVKQLSTALPQWGIRANAICPGSKSIL
ncbi:NAD(P)-binding protein [Biscogniauxia marginata]|nr:NAD(P)-binding protein [Biscogniauxia marginata]